MASRSAFPCRAVQSGASNKLIFVAFILFAFLPSGDSFLPGHLSAPSGGGRERCQRVRPTLPISLTSRGPRRLCGLFSLRGGGTAAEERAPLRDGEKKDNEKRLVPPGAVYGMGVGAITASRIAHEAHLQGYYINKLGLPATVVALGWTVFCIIIAVLEPLIGVTIDQLRSRGIATPTVLLALLPLWLLSVLLIWAPPTSVPPLMFAGVLLFGILQATMNLGLLSIYPSLFSTKEARASALVPQQVFTVAGLLLGMTLPAILSNEWRFPKVFATGFTAIIGVVTLASLLLLAPRSPDKARLGLDKSGSAELPRGPGGEAAGDLKPPPPRFGVRQLTSIILGNGAFSLILGTIFLAQLGNALLASTLPIFARQVMDLSRPVGPFMWGVIPPLTSQWQFSVCYLVFYIMGAASGPLWSKLVQSRGAVPTLRRAFLMYSVGCAALPLLPGGLLADFLSAAGPSFAPLAEWMRSGIGTFSLFVGCYVWNGLALGGMVALPDLIIAEAVVASGEESRAGAMYGAKQLVYRVASASQGILTALVMSLTGYMPGVHVQSETARNGLRFLVGFLPCLFYLLAAAVAKRVPQR